MDTLIDNAFHIAFDCLGLAIAVVGIIAGLATICGAGAMLAGLAIDFYRALLRTGPTPTEPAKQKGSA